MGSAPKQMRSHYQEIAAGWEQWLTRHHCTLLPVRNATWTANGLTVKVHHHIGLRLSDGRTIAALPYLKQPSLTQAGADVALRIMEQLMDRILPSATPAVIDVRRAKFFTLRSNTRRRRLDTWLQAEAAGYVAHWLASTA